MIFTKATAVALLFLALAGAGAQAASKSSQLAVMPLSGRGIDSSATTTIEEAVASELLRHPGIRIMERSQIAKVLGEQGFQNSGACSSNECAVEMGRLLSVDRLLVGSVGRVGETYSLTLRLVDVASGEILGATTRNQSGAIDQVLTSLVPQSVEELLKDKNVPVAPVPVAKSASAPVWPWIVGGVVVAGGATVALLLASGDAKTATATTTNAGTANVEFVLP